MMFPRRLRAPALAFGCALALGFASAAVAAADDASTMKHYTLAVLPLSPVDTGMPYAPLPRTSELDAMSVALRGPFAGTSSAVIVPAAKTAHALQSAGFEQNSLLRACATPECARRIGKMVGADRVVMGGVTREMGVVWSTDLTVIDVRTGKTVTELQAGYKGDAMAMIEGEKIVATCVVRVLNHKKPCENDPGF